MTPLLEDNMALKKLKTDRHKWHAWGRHGSGMRAEVIWRTCKFVQAVVMKKEDEKTANKFIFSFQTTQLSESWDLIEYFSMRWLGSMAGLGRQRGILYVLQIKLSYDFYTTFFSLCLSWHTGASQVDSVVKNPPAKQETWVWSLGWEDPMEKEMATHSSILAWEIPWTEEPGRLQSLGSGKSQIWLSN